MDAADRLTHFPTRPGARNGLVRREVSQLFEELVLCSHPGLTLSGRPGCPGLSPEIPPALTDSVSTCRTEERELRHLRTQSAQLKSDFKKILKSVGFISPLRDLKIFYLKFRISPPPPERTGEGTGGWGIIELAYKLAAPSSFPQLNPGCLSFSLKGCRLVRSYRFRSALFKMDVKTRKRKLRPTSQRLIQSFQILIILEIRHRFKFQQQLQKKNIRCN